MWIGWLEFDVLLGDVHSLKEKRGIVRPLVAALWKGFPVAVAEVDDQDLHRRGGRGGAGDAAHLAAVLDDVERFVAERPEVQLLSAHRGLTSSDDD
jgi:uncharacterized protein YlxP (DUF503 family)